MIIQQKLGKVMITPKGDYVGGTPYKILDFVKYNGNGYLAKADNTNVLPTDTSKWMKVVDKPVKGVDYFDSTDKEEIVQDVLEEVPSYTIEIAQTTAGYAKSYELLKDGVAIGVKIDIPKDMVIESGTIETATETDVPYEGAVIGDKYLDIVLNDTAETHIYIAVKDLVDVYTSGNGININGNNVVSIVIDPTSSNLLTVGPNGLKLDVSTLLTKTGDVKDVTVTFSEAETRTNIATGEKFSVTLGKIKKFFTDLATIAFSGSYSDLSGKPTSLSSINQQEATKLNNIATGAQVNTIEGIQIDGVDIVPDANKKVKITMEARDHIYGIKRKRTDTSSTWIRINDSVGLTADATKTGAAVVNDFDEIYPWSDIKTYNYDVESGEITAWIGDADFKFDGTNGEVLTLIPEFYFKHIIQDDYEYYYITRYAKAGYTKSEEFSVGRYKMSESNNVGHSISGANLSTNRTITSHRTIATALGTGFGQMDWRYFVIQMLYLVEYADYNSQTKLGNGATSLSYVDTTKSLLTETGANRILIATSFASTFIVGQQIDIGTSQGGRQVVTYRTITAINTNTTVGEVTGTEIVFDGDPVNIAIDNIIYSCGQNTGGCDDLGMKSGCINNDGKHSMIYRGIEDILGNVFEWIDGINIKSVDVEVDGVTVSKRLAYINYNPATYQADKFDGDYQPLGYYNANSDGYGKSLGYDSANPLISMTDEIGGGSTTGLCDYYYQATGFRVLCVGGGFDGGAYAGLWYFSASGSSSSSHLDRGARLLKY